ncbi:hypothetical protein R3P38DRAFT_3225808 [Favolaschia claudopus]|uniref:Uncharacterized protein n=1 Tax=Favolaschia claudopus TaxID=2862362 RepID=A0AAV9ZVA9_9AGAR
MSPKDVARIRTPAIIIEESATNKKRKGREQSSEAKQKKLKVTKKSGLTTSALAAQVRAKQTSNVVVEDEDLMAQYGGYVDDDEQEKVQDVVVARGKKRGLPTVCLFPLQERPAWRPPPLAISSRLSSSSSRSSTASTAISGPTVRQVQSVVDRVYGDGKYSVEKDGVWYDLRVHPSTSGPSTLGFHWKTVVGGEKKVVCDPLYLRPPPHRTRRNPSGVRAHGPMACGTALIAAQAVERILKYWGSGYEAPPTNDTDAHFSRDQWDDKYEKNKHGQNVLTERRATKYLRALSGWDEKHWEHFLADASMWKERKRRRGGSSVASSEVEDYPVVEDDTDGDGLVLSD